MINILSHAKGVGATISLNEDATMCDLRRDKTSALGHAAAHLCKSMGTARQGRESLRELRTIQREILLNWCTENSRVFKTSPLLSFDRVQSHGEHTVAYHEASRCWWKTTHPGKCGIGPEFDYSDLPPFSIDAVSARELLPLEYLERMLLQNRIFGDDVRFEGFITGAEPSLLISQPDIEGAPATESEMISSMDAMGFQRLDDIHIGRENSISFYDQLRKIAVFDAHPGNFFVSGGFALPIDGIVVEISSAIEHQWLLDRLAM